MTQDEIVVWHHQLNGHEFEQTLVKDKKPGMLQSMGSQRVGHILATEQQQRQIFLDCLCQICVVSLPQYTVIAQKCCPSETKLPSPLPLILNGESHSCQ